MIQENIKETTEGGLPIRDFLALMTMTIDENAALSGRLTRLCRAVSTRMQADDPTPHERRELMEAYDSACALLADAPMVAPPTQDSNEATK